MFEIVSGKQMKKIEQKWINDIGVPALSLMESAANSIANEIKSTFTTENSVLALANVGNNGGDALAVARHLIQNGYSVECCLIGDSGKMTFECKTQYDILINMNAIFVNADTMLDRLSQYDLLIDGIFGIGLTRNVSGTYADLINNLNESSCKVISIDIPSGINADNGTVMGVAVKADITVELGIRKLGNHIYPGCEYAGKIIYSDIGLNNYFHFETVKSYENSDIRELLPRRYNDSNKGTYGKVLCICGSYNMAGAAVLSATAAYRTGAGLVKIYTDSRNREIIQRSIPEALLSTYEDMDFKDELIPSINWADTILIGCGLGQSDVSRSIVAETLKYIYDYNSRIENNAKKKLVIDADGLNIISADNNLSGLIPTNAIITPHIIEMSRLCGKSVSEIKENRIETANEYAKQHDCVVVLKDSRTVISSYTGDTVLNMNGNNGMSTGGSGDVLAGIISSIYSSSKDAFESAIAGVYMHGLSADLQIGHNTYETLISSDISSGISEAYKLVTNDKK